MTLTGIAKVFGDVAQFISEFYAKLMEFVSGFDKKYEFELDD